MQPTDRHGLRHKKKEATSARALHKMGKRQFILGMATVLLLIIIISCANATRVETVQVAPLSETTLTFNLDKEDKFSGALSISGGEDNDIRFWITDPSGNTTVDLGRMRGRQGTTFEFTAQESGAYTLHFDNSFSLISWKTVRLYYDISRPSPFDIDILIIMGILLIATAIVIALGVLLYRRKTQAIPKSS